MHCLGRVVLCTSLAVCICVFDVAVKVPFIDFTVSNIGDPLTSKKLVALMEL